MSFCPSCGVEVASEARFCSSCGTKLPSGGPARHPTSSGIRAERRQLTVMFCDIADSTKLSERLDPEDLMEVVRRYQRVCVEAIENMGGSIAQYLGDGLLVYFGFPTAYENAPERAARAGLAILDGLDTLNEGLQREFGVSLKVRLGVHTGLVVIGEVGAGAKREQLAVGDTANIAARLEALAAPNTGIVSDATRALLGGLVETESLGEHALKGIATPMEIHRILRLSAARHRLDHSVPVDTPFVGRDPEIAVLLKHWESAEQGAGGGVLLVAEAGVGKSRMIPAFRERLQGRAFRLHRAYCSPFHESSVLHPMVEMLRVEAEIGRDDDPVVALGRLATWLSSRATGHDDALPLLASLLDIPPEAGYEALALSPQAIKAKTTAALLESLLPGPSDPPVLFVLEDVHWVDPSTLDLIGQLVPRLPEERVMLLMTARPVFESPWTDTTQIVYLRLRPFSQANTRALVLAMTEGHSLPDDVLSQLVERTDGIPLFVEELTRMLIDAGQLQQTMDGAIPTTLRDSLMARLDQIDPVARKVAQLGATLGRTFGLSLLQRIYTGEEGELRRGIDDLLAAKLIHRKAAGTDQFIFKHALIQDAAYESLLKRTRQQYHDRIAAVLGEGFGHLAEAQPELLAHHLEAAGPSRRGAAISAWLEAGQKAQASSSNQEAESHFRRGLALIEAEPDGPERVQLELSLQSKLGTSLSALKGYAADEVEQAYARAHVLCEQLGPTPERFWVLWGLWAFYLVQGTHTKGVRYAEMMLELADEQASESLELEAHFSLGLSFFFMGDDLDSARMHLEWVVDRYDAKRHHGQAVLTGQDVGVTSRSVSALVHFQLGEYETAAARHEQALALSDTLGHAFSRAYALGCAAWYRLYTRDHTEAQALANEAVALSQEQSFGWWLVWGMILGGSAGAGLHDAAAAATIEQWIAAWRQTGSGFTVPYFLGLLCDARVHDEELDVAASLLQEATTLADDNRERFFFAELHRLSGELCLLREGQAGAAAAEGLFREAMAIAEAQGARAFGLRAATSLAGLLRELDRGEDAKSLLRTHLQPFGDVTGNADVDAAQALLDLP